MLLILGSKLKTFKSKVNDIIKAKKGNSFSYTFEWVSSTYKIIDFECHLRNEVRELC